MNARLQRLIEQTEAEKDDIIFCLTDENITQELLNQADLIRKKFVGDEIHLRGLIEFSNICKRNCKYCGLRSSNQNIERYQLTPDEIVNYAKKAYELGLKTIVLQSGENDCYSTKTICEIIARIKEFDMAVTLSIGEKTATEYKAFKKAGANRYLLKIETTDSYFYQSLHPRMNFVKRVECLFALKDLDYELGSGLLVGLPNQTIDSIADDLLFLTRLEPDMVSIGPFIPSPDTPLAKAKADGNFDLALKTMAIARLLLPQTNIPATTAMETLTPNGQILALQSGANVIMPNIVDIELREKYSIYPNKAGKNTSSIDTINMLQDKIHSIGRTISTDYGNSITWNNRKHYPID